MLWTSRKVEFHTGYMVEYPGRCCTPSANQKAASNSDCAFYQEHEGTTVITTAERNDKRILIIDCFRVHVQECEKNHLCTQNVWRLFSTTSDIESNPRPTRGKSRENIVSTYLSYSRNKVFKKGLYCTCITTMTMMRMTFKRMPWATLGFSGCWLARWIPFAKVMSGVTTGFCWISTWPRVWMWVMALAVRLGSTPRHSPDWSCTNVPAKTPHAI